MQPIPSFWRFWDKLLMRSSKEMLEYHIVLIKPFWEESAASTIVLVILIFPLRSVKV